METKDAEVSSPNGTRAFVAKHRKCTDVLCLLLFAIFWVGMLAIAAVGLNKGQPEKLIYGVDFHGRTCGAKTSSYDLTSYPYLMFPRLSEDLFDLSLNEAVLDPENYKSFFGVCVRECPSPFTDDTNEQQYVHAYVDYATHPEPVNTNAESVDEEETAAGSPWPVALNTTNVLFRCLDLGELHAVASARCVDACDRENAVNCGTDLDTNPFVECGADGCTAYLENTIPSCRVAETKEETITKDAARGNPIYDQLQSSTQLLLRWLGDLEKSAVPVLLCGGVFAFALGLVWLILLQHCAGVFVWISIALTFCMLLVGTVYAAFRGNLLEFSMVTSYLEDAGVAPMETQDLETYVNKAGFESSQDSAHYWAIGAYLFLVVDALALLLLCFLCSRIKIAIGIIREASKAIKSMPLLIVFPLIPTAMILCLVVYWLVVTGYVMTSGEITVETITDTYAEQTGDSADTFKLQEYSDSNLSHWLLMYHVFGLLWTNEFLQALAYTAIAGAVAEYYWTLDKKTMARFPIGRSVQRTMRYHLGTLAFGALLIAIVQCIRLVLEYVDQKTRRAQESNKVVKVALYCCKCFLWCFEKCIKYLNKNAYIITAMKGSSFCHALKESFSLLLANAARVATVGVISGMLLVLAKLFIVAFSVSTMLLFIYNPPANIPTFVTGELDRVSSPIFPLLLTALLSFAIASFFLSIYETAIDTILLCFCEDCQVNKTSGTYYMSDELLSFVDGAAKKNAFRRYKTSEA